MHPFAPREVLDVSVIAHRNKSNLRHADLAVAPETVRAVNEPLPHQSVLLHSSATGAHVPTWEPESRDCQQSVLCFYSPWRTAKLWRQGEVIDCELLLEAPFADFELLRVVCFAA